MYLISCGPPRWMSKVMPTRCIIFVDEHISVQWRCYLMDLLHYTLWSASQYSIMYVASTTENFSLQWTFFTILCEPLAKKLSFLFPLPTPCPSGMVVTITVQSTSKIQQMEMKFLMLGLSGGPSERESVRCLLLLWLLRTRTLLLLTLSNQQNNGYRHQSSSLST